MVHTSSRGPYRKSYLVAHRKSWKYKRAVPRDLQDVLGRKVWVEMISGATHTPRQAEAAARAFAVRDDQLMERLRGPTASGAR